MAKHLTPAERAKIVARYVETANASQVAREFDVSEYTVRQSAARAESLRKNELHAQACARGIREGRRALSKTSKRLQAWLAKLGDPDAPGMEPGDVSKIANSLRAVVSGLVEVDEHRAKTKLSKLTRDLRRAEIELAKLKIAAGGVDQHQHVVTPQAAAQLAREVFGSPSALERKTDDPGPSGDGAVAGNVLPVPTRVDQ